MLVELNHVIEPGAATYPGLPPPAICDFWQRDSHDGFHIARIDMIVNSGTYIDAPFHRFVDGDDIAQLELEKTTALRGRCFRFGEQPREIDCSAFEGQDLEGRAILLHTGWDRFWQTDAYSSPNPFLGADAAEFLKQAGVALVGIDSINIDDRSQASRPAHEILLGAGIPIVEHLTALDRIPDAGFRFHAAPARVSGVGSFPVRAYAEFD